MTESLLIDAMGVVVRIDLAGLDQGDADAVRDAWRDALATDGAEAVSAVTPVSGPSRAAMLMTLSQRVTYAALEALRGDLWMVHAAGLALADGRVVMLIGPSGRGKTTASRVLAKEFGYVSDESIGIESDGSVRPYRKPLSIIEEAGRPKAERAPSQVGLKPLPEAALRLAAIVLLDRRADGPLEPLVRSVDLADALEDIVSQSSHLPEMDSPLWTIARHADETGGVVRVTYREAGSLASLIEPLASRPRIATAARPSLSARDSRSAHDEGAPRYERGRSIDAVSFEGPDRIALLHRGGLEPPTVRVLAGVAPALWRSASGATLESLVAAAVDEYGEPEGIDAHRAVAAAVAELVAAGVLTKRV